MQKSADHIHMQYKGSVMLLLRSLLTILMITSASAFNDSGYGHSTKIDFGKELTDNCSNNCAICVSDDPNDCEICKQGWYTTTCSQPCINCVGECSINNGCCHQCKAGFWGERCNFRCPENCQKYKNERLCHKLSGTCVEGCIQKSFGSGKSRWYGDYCNETCSPFCADNQCDNNGFCTRGCRDGYYGHHCHFECSRNCVNSVCEFNKTFGIPECSQGCVDGWMDVDCGRKCPANCISCDRFSGVCSHCPTTWSGPSCNKSCSVNCVNRTCDTMGRCIEGCVRGWQGELCDSTHKENCCKTNVYFPVAIVSIIATVILVCLVIILYLRYSSLKGKLRFIQQDQSVKSSEMYSFCNSQNLNEDTAQIDRFPSKLICSE